MSRKHPRRKSRDLPEVEKETCYSCGHDRAWVKPRGVNSPMPAGKFCTRCGKDTKKTKEAYLKRKQ